MRQGTEVVLEVTGLVVVVVVVVVDEERKKEKKGEMKKILPKARVKHYKHLIYIIFR